METKRGLRDMRKVLDLADAVLDAQARCDAYAKEVAGYQKALSEFGCRVDDDGNLAINVVLESEPVAPPRQYSEFKIDGCTPCHLCSNSAGLVIHRTSGGERCPLDGIRLDVCASCGSQGPLVKIDDARNGCEPRCPNHRVPFNAKTPAWRHPHPGA